MKVGVVCPIGRLDRYGYQNVSDLCIGSMADFAERVYLVQSTRERGGVDEILKEHEEVRLISDERTWFSMWNGEEFFDIYRVISNAQRGRMEAEAEGMDAVVKLECNQYVPRAAGYWLRERCEQACEKGKEYDWYYRKDFVGGVMFHANLRRPWILPKGTQWNFWIDSVDCGGNMVRHERGNWPEMDEYAVVDAQLEMTLEDYAAKMTFLRNYVDLEPSRGRVFRWEFWKDYLIRKYAKKEMGGRLDEIGKRLKERTRDDFIGQEILRGLAI